MNKEGNKFDFGLIFLTEDEVIESSKKDLARFMKHTPTVLLDLLKKNPLLIKEIIRITENNKKEEREKEFKKFSSPPLIK